MVRCRLALRVAVSHVAGVHLCCARVQGVAAPAENIYGNAGDLSVHEHLYDNSGNLSMRQSMSFQSVESFYAGVNVDPQASKMYATKEEVMSGTGPRMSDSGPRMSDGGPSIAGNGASESDYETIGGLDELTVDGSGTLRRNHTDI